MESGHSAGPGVQAATQVPQELSMHGRLVYEAGVSAMVEHGRDLPIMALVVFPSPFDKHLINTCIEIDASSAQEKLAASYMVKRLAEQLGATHVIFASSAWAAFPRPGAAYTPPSESPDRVEVLVVQEHTPDHTVSVIAFIDGAPKRVGKVDTNVRYRDPAARPPSQIAHSTRVFANVFFEMSAPGYFDELSPEHRQHIESEAARITESLTLRIAHAAGRTVQAPRSGPAH